STATNRGTTSCGPMPSITAALACSRTRHEIHGCNRDGRSMIRPSPAHTDGSPDDIGGRQMAGRFQAALGTLAFLVLAPGVVAGLIPWLITRWSPLPPADLPGALRWGGLVLI